MSSTINVPPQKAWIVLGESGWGDLVLFFAGDHGTVYAYDALVYYVFEELHDCF